MSEGMSQAIDQRQSRGAVPVLPYVIGLFAPFVLGVAYWDFRSGNGLHDIVTRHRATPHDLQDIVAYGVPVFAVLVLLAVGFAWDLRRRGSRVGLRDMAASLWPGLLIAPVLAGAVYRFHHEDVLLLYFAPVFGLTLGNLIGAYIEARTPDATDEPEEPRRLRLWLGAAGALIALYIGWFGYLCIYRHFSFGSCLHDFGIYDQLMWNTIHGRPFECGMFQSEIMGYHLSDYGNNIFAEHFIPTFWIVTPLYWLYPSPLTVLVAQAAVLALASLPVFLIALKKLRSPIVALLFALAFLNHPIVQQTTIKDVHADAFAPLFLLGAFAAYLWGRRALYWVLLVLALGSKEEISVNVAGLGLFLFLGEKDRKTGAITLGLGLLWYVAVIGFLIPWFRNGEPIRQMYRYAMLLPPGTVSSFDEITPGLLVKSMILHPVYTFQQVADQYRLQSIFMLAAPFAFFVFWTRWAAWLWVLPVAAVTLLASYLHQARLGAYYGIPIVSCVTVASVYGAARWLGTLRDPDAPPRRSRVVMVSVALAVSIGMLWYEYGFTPGGKRYLPIDYKVLPHDELAAKYLDAIPADAVVSAQLEVGAHLTQRRFVYLYPEVLDAEYILLDTRMSPWPLPRDQVFFRQIVEELLRSDDWGLILPYEDGYLLFRKGNSTALNAEALDELNFKAYRPRRFGL